MKNDKLNKIENVSGDDQLKKINEMASKSKIQITTYAKDLADVVLEQKSSKSKIQII